MITKEYLLERVMPIPECGCWVWLGAWSPQGYGTVCFKKRTYRAHRVSYELFRGPIPSPLVIDHLCRVRCCINPDHLEVVTNRENTLRGVSPTALNKRKMECPLGHPYTFANTYVSPAGERNCRECNKIQSRIAKRAWRAQLKLEGRKEPRWR